jgi:hypothetical protein
MNSWSAISRRSKYKYYQLDQSAIGITTAHGAKADRVGKVKLKDSKDMNGKGYGKEFFAVATEGELKKVAYKFPRPGEKEPSEKCAFISKVGDRIWGIGHYKISAADFHHHPPFQRTQRALSTPERA